MTLFRAIRAWVVFRLARWLFVGREVYLFDLVDGGLHPGRIHGSQYVMGPEGYPVSITFFWRHDYGDMAFGPNKRVTVDRIEWHSGKRAFFFAD